MCLSNLEQSWHLFALSEHATACDNKFLMTVSPYLALAGRSSQRHATLPTSYKVLIRTEKVALQYYKVLQSTTLYYKVLFLLQSTTPCYTVLQNTIPQYYSVLLSATKYYSILKNLTRNVIDIARSNRTGVTVQAHQILCLPRKKILMIGPCHIQNVMYNAPSKRCHCPINLTKYCACHEK